MKSTELQRLKIGLNKYLPVYITERYTQILLMGKSGVGKSTSIANWWHQDCLWRVGKVLIDPTGILAEQCYSLSRGAAYYCSLNTPISINPMRAPYNPNQISDNIAEAINQVITITTPNENMTSKMRVILDDAVKKCLKNNRRSLLNVRDHIVNLSGDVQTRDGLLARLNFILNDERIVPILCGGNSLEWGKFIDDQETFIMDCSGMSKEKMVFTGSLISQGIKNYFRYERPPVYRPIALYIDECHNFLNPNFFDILKEGRKYKLSTVLATQDFSTIDFQLKRVMLNLGNIVCYRVGHAEAVLISKELNTTPEVLQSLDKYHFAYMTFKEKGTAKALRPPITNKMQIKARPQKKFEQAKWFPLEPIGA